MTESNAVENLLPEGWYSDPANEQMQRWWTGTGWTDHVRYADRPRLQAVTAHSHNPAPLTAEPPQSEPAPAVHSPAPLSAATRDAQLRSAFDDFYVPMRGFSSPSSATPPSSARSSVAAAGLWLLVVASIGIAVGVGLWVLLPH